MSSHVFTLKSKWVFGFVAFGEIDISIDIWAGGGRYPNSIYRYIGIDIYLGPWVSDVIVA